MTQEEEGKKATLTISLKRTDTLRIANVPAGTTFTITETGRDDYDFVSAVRGVTGITEYDDRIDAPQEASIDGTIVPNKEMNVTFTNKKVVQYDVDILKKNAMNGEVLSGVVFSLYKNDYYEKDPETGEPTNVINTQAVPLKTGLTSGMDGKLQLGKLKSDTYYLVETKAPDGFLLAEPITITVDRNSTLTKYVGNTDLPLFVTYHQKGYSGSDDYTGIDINVSETATNDGTITTYSYTLTVTNNPGVELPATGGITTIPIYLLGVFLTIASGMMLLTKSKTANISH